MDLDLLEPKLGERVSCSFSLSGLKYVGRCWGEGQVPCVSQGYGAVLQSEGGSSSSVCEELQFAVERLRPSIHTNCPGSPEGSVPVRSIGVGAGNTVGFFLLFLPGARAHYA